MNIHNTKRREWKMNTFKQQKIKMRKNGDEKIGTNVSKIAIVFWVKAENRMKSKSQTPYHHVRNANEYASKTKKQHQYRYRKQQRNNRYKKKRKKKKINCICKSMHQIELTNNKFKNKQPNKNQSNMHSQYTANRCSRTPTRPSTTTTKNHR